MEHAVSDMPAQTLPAELSTRDTPSGKMGVGRSPLSQLDTENSSAVVNAIRGKVDQLIVSNEDRRGYEFFHRRTFMFWQDHFQSICREVDGQIVGGFAYTDFTGSSVQMHMAGATPTWITRRLLWIAFNYPFDQLGCKVIIGSIAAGNEPGLSLARKLGFTYYGTIPGAHPDGDGLVLWTMRRDQCKWLDLSRTNFHGKGRSHTIGT